MSVRTEPAPDHALDTRSSLDGLEVKLAPGWSRWSQNAVRVMLYLLYILFFFALMFILDSVGLSSAVERLDVFWGQRPLLGLILFGLPLLLMEMVVMYAVDEWIAHIAREWRPALTLTQATVQVGRQAPIPLSAVQDWSVTPRHVTINGKRRRVRLTTAGSASLHETLAQAVARNQPDGLADQSAVPASLQQLRSTDPSLRA